MHFTLTRQTAILIAGPLLLATLTACGPQVIAGTAGPGGSVTDTATPTTDSSATAGASTPAVPTEEWKGTTQFLQIKNFEESDGVEYLEVREAEKKTEGKTVETVSLDGPWIQVKISSSAVNVPKQGVGGDSGQLSASLSRRSTSEIVKGFDVTFDKKGQVSKVTWLYVSAREFATAVIETWKDSTQFLQIKSARKVGETTYLRVRPAEKEYLGESFETKTIPGPWIEVVMSALANNVPIDAETGDADALRTMLSKRSASQVKEGFDITFAGNGQVSEVTWLYGSVG